MAKMTKVSHLVAGWEQKRQEEMDVIKRKETKAKKGKAVQVAPVAEDDHEIFDNDVEANTTQALFGDSDDSDDDAPATQTQNETVKKSVKEGGISKSPQKNVPKEEDLFGDSSDEESDEELIPGGKRDRKNPEDVDSQANKKRRVNNNLDD